ncbi:MAG: 4Fe-4S binding protein [Syntrophaceae bacterium]|nr:4Fe-4S binding protein [Syntrophaceae bacterium]
MNRFQRIIQAISLSFFLILIFWASHPFRSGIPTDLFLRLDPSIGIVSSIADRTVLWEALLPAGAVLLLTLILGRFFCGYICPMGVMLDACGSFIQSDPSRNSQANSYENTSKYRKCKSLFLIFVVFLAICGVSFVFWGSPISLATRFIALVVHPLVLLAGDTGIELLASFESHLPQITYMQIPNRVFATNEFVAILFLVIALLSLIQPRFWCRNLCPAGAIFSIFSHRSVVKRQVNDSCIHCNLCLKNCPTGCINEDHVSNVNSECIVCLKCSKICPVSAISFGPHYKGTRPPTVQVLNSSFPTRRQTLAGMASGLVFAGLIKTGWNQPRLMGQEKRLTDAELLRPPGSIPEREFLARCVRCGLCMKACPTNTLQPLWFKAGLEGMFTPVLAPRLAACELNCATCGQVCPTSAIRPLDLAEKKSVKIGTAWIDRQACLVWNQDKKCLVCDEVCPYNAVIFKPTEGRKNAVPHVIPNKCTGCGWCENKCPVEGTSAIRINIIGEVRLASGSYIEKSKEYGLEFKTEKLERDILGPETFDSQPAVTVPNDASNTSATTKPSELPPGFIED